MQPGKLIPLEEFCSHHHIEVSFIRSLQQTGLIEVTVRKETGFIEADHLRQLERIARFHYEMDINIEGIETITHLLQRIITLQNEITALKNRLLIYEADEE